MSRCFPYPPPGFVCNRAAGDKALIESIKIEKEREKIKQDKKEQKRREKDLKKKEKKEKKESDRLKSVQRVDGSNKRKRDCDGFDNVVKKSCLVNDKEFCLQKKIIPESEQLERSSLTEEYGQPMVAESLCYSSDGTYSKTKKSRVEQPCTNASCTTEGKVIRFKLKQRETENALSTDDRPSTSGRTEEPDTKRFVPLRNDDGVIPRLNDQIAIDATAVKEERPIAIKSSSSSKKVSRRQSAYEALFSEWVPPPIQFDAMEVNDDDQTWLLRSKKPATQGGSISKSCDSLSGQLNPSLWPRAQLLPEMDLHVLPYTVLF